jgi:serine/threonine protein kinase
MRCGPSRCVMGVVYRAEQTRTVKRRVALKVIKVGMDSRTVLARFDAERQALALMDHPNIARVYDGGSTEVGQPFFVMELVKGVPYDAARAAKDDFASRFYQPLPAARANANSS